MLQHLKGEPFIDRDKVEVVERNATLPVYMQEMIGYEFYHLVCQK